jgi:uncharacterized Tic20 family protein
MTTQSEKNTAALIHISAFAKYLIPLAGIIVPLIIWQAKKNDSDLINENGKSVINFHISLLMYSIIAIIIVAIFGFTTILKYIEIEQSGGDIFPIEIITGAIIGVFVLGIWTIIEFILTIIASVKASEGKIYKYPFTINFIK